MKTGEVIFLKLHVRTRKKDDDGVLLKEPVKEYGTVAYYKVDLKEVQQRHLNLVINAAQYYLHKYLPPDQ